MKLHEPIGNNLWAPLFVRLALGAYFLLDGYAKHDDIPNLIQQVEAMRLFPEPWTTLYAILLPFVEMTVGALLLFGSWTTLAAIVGSLLLITFVLAFGIVLRPREILNKDVVLLAAALSLLYSGSGALSIDRFRKLG